MNTATRRREVSTRRRSLVAFLAGALALAGCGGDATEQAIPDNEAATTSVTAAPPAPVIEAISGNQVDFGDTLTQDTVLWFWAPW